MSALLLCLCIFMYCGCTDKSLIRDVICKHVLLLCGLSFHLLESAFLENKLLLIKSNVSILFLLLVSYLRNGGLIQGIEIDVYVFFQGFNPFFVFDESGDDGHFSRRTGKGEGETLLGK